MNEKEKDELYNEFKKRLLNEFFLSPKTEHVGTLKPHDILSIVCKYFGLTENELSNKSREQSLLYARQFYYKLSREYTTAGWPMISSLVKKVHAVAYNGFNRINGYIETEPKTKADYENLKKIIEWKKDHSQKA